MHISKNKRCFNVKCLAYCFHMKTNILTDFQICISVPVKCDACAILVSFIQFKKREKQPWRIVAKPCNFTKSDNCTWVFFTFFKLYKWYQIAQNISNELVSIHNLIGAVARYNKCLLHVPNHALRDQAI